MYTAHSEVKTERVETTHDEVIAVFIVRVALHDLISQWEMPSHVCGI